MDNLDCKNIIIDVDGVLTDNKVWFDHQGNRTKGFNSSDIWAIRELISRGYYVALVTASSWPGIDQFARRTGAAVLYERDKETMNISEFICVINDVWDFGLAKKAVQVYAPSDAYSGLFTKFPKTILIPCKGGDGVISHLVAML